MTGTEGLWMTRETHIRRKTEMAALRSQRDIGNPLGFLDYDDNRLLGNAMVGEDPLDDGIAAGGHVGEQRTGLARRKELT